MLTTLYSYHERKKPVDGIKKNVIRSKRLKVTTFLYVLVNVFNIKESINSKNETCRYHDLDNHKITIKGIRKIIIKWGGAF